MNRFIPAPATRRVQRFSPASAYALAAFVFAADAASKYGFHENTAYGWSWPVTDFFNLVHARNQGAAFSFLADAGGWQRLFLTGLALLVSAGLLWLLQKPLPLLERLAYSLILGGALGNGVDRGMRGYVVDFLDFHWRGWHWPAFNVADIAIFCGVALMFSHTLAMARSPATSRP